MTKKVVKLVDADGKPLSDKELYLFLRGIADNEWEIKSIEGTADCFYLCVDDVVIKFRELGG